ncbi:MAG TPA: stage II sporulation protein M [Pirellulaceae bacterium]|nr:stage II sporulation protein M [Pirellulaceae bacterium]HMO91415.1 stage II sporulation protein M [Pirellulaceae bacterium]HMP69640.1 stage II sporulation protein M [Pirellulaceae bacterium]
MKPVKLLQNREANWAELESLCARLRISGRNRNPALVSRFSSLYRAACADLALAEAYQLPPEKIEYLQSLVARAHNTLYQNQGFQIARWFHLIFYVTPKLIFSDRCVHLALFVWLFLSTIAAVLAYDDRLWPGFAEQVLGTSTMLQMENDFRAYVTRSWGQNFLMAGFYIWNNAGIGLRCFATGILIVPGFFLFAVNAVQIGASFGYMFRPELGIAGANFKDFVTVHGPFEITAIILSFGAGLRLGVSWLTTREWSRMSALILAGRRALPIAFVAVLLFVLAAMLEGFVSPFSRNTIPWFVKGSISVICSGLLMFYFIVLGYPGIEDDQDIDLEID